MPTTYAGSSTLYVNDEDVRFSGGLSAPTTDGDVVVVLPAVAGGS